MHYRFTFVVAATIGMILNSAHSQLADRHTSVTRIGHNGDVFNLLLGLYKLNPLKGSQVYRTFTKYLLSSGTDRDRKRIVTNFDSNESGKKLVKSSLKEIEKVIHTRSNKPAKIISKPEYDIENVDIENFTVDIVVNDRLTPNDYVKKVEINDNQDNFSSIFGHIESDEIDNDLVTKLLPVKDNIMKSFSVPNVKSNEQYKHTDDKNKPADSFNRDSLVSFRKDAQDAEAKRDNLNADEVIVL